MTMTKKRISVMLGAMLLMTMGLIGFQRATAVTPGLYEVDGNPGCLDLYTATVLEGPDTDLLDLGPLFGLKYDANPTGNVSNTLTDNAPWVVTSGPQDPDNSVSIFNVLLKEGGEGVQFDWSSTLGLDAVIVKASGANAYVYSPEAFGSANLVAPSGSGVSHIEFCYDYELTATKTADADYTRTYTWDITKDWDSEYWKFIGDPATSHAYEVSVDQTVTDSAFGVSGTITVKNPTPFIVGFSVTDWVDATTEAAVNCPADQLAPNDGAEGGADEVTCTYTYTYTASLGGAVDGTNTATITSNNADVLGAVATADYTFGDPTTIVGYPAINVTDTNGEAWTASGDDSWKYNNDFACSTNPADYTDGFYSYDHVNTATITETEQSDDATVTVNCYAPVVTKNAKASYDETWTWTLKKSVDQTDQSGFPGDVLDWTWTVTVDEFFAEDNFVVSGGITVKNPSGSPGNMTVDLADELDDTTIATVDCGAGVTSVTVAPGATETCSYSASPTGLTATLNTATGTFNSINVIATADVTFVKNVVNGTATVDDDQESDFPVNLVAGDLGTRKWTETQNDTCSTDWADYGEDGTYSETLTNDATLTSDDQNLKAGADTSYTCEAGAVDVAKLTDGLVNPDKDWRFALYVGPDGFGGTQVGNTSSTLDDADGVLDFGLPALRPDTTYTVCELEVMAGWSSFWQVDVDGDDNFVTVNPYNPNAEASEDLGNRCVDFGFETTMPVTVGTTIRFKVDNTYPGGDPRTPGYWKNWNSCTGGGQADTAYANGGWEDGYWLLDDVINGVVGDGIVWDDILTDDAMEFPINSCELAVDILDKREVKDHDIVGDGKKKASDPLINLATHLLAAQLNFGAGACTDTVDSALGRSIHDVALDAEELLDEFNFVGEAGAMGKKDPLKDLAYSLAYDLDEYNNGEYCGTGGGS